MGGASRDGYGRPVQRFAVSDGATESAYARLWASLLANRFVGRALGGSLSARADRAETGLAAARATWLQQVGRGEIPWYLEQKIEQGAYATLLGVEIRLPRSVTSPAPARVRALAVGDSCLFLARGGQLVRGFPIRSSTDFGNRPKLIGSRPETADPLATLAPISMKFYPGDVLYLTTDALAQYLLRQYEAGNPAWAELERIATQNAPEAFGGWIDERRGYRLMRNDDVALLRIARMSPGELPRADDASGG